MVIYLNLILKKSPCLRCFMPEIPTNNSCDAEGILSTTAGVLGTLQANRLLKLY